MRARAVIEEKESSNKSQIVVTELPYQVNKAKLIIDMVDLVKEAKLEGISALRDESDKDGMRIVIELKRDAIPRVVLNHLVQAHGDAVHPSASSAVARARREHDTARAEDHGAARMCSTTNPAPAHQNRRTPHAVRARQGE